MSGGTMGEGSPRVRDTGARTTTRRDTDTHGDARMYTHQHDTRRIMSPLLYQLSYWPERSTAHHVSTADTPTQSVGRGGDVGGVLPLAGVA